jgi:hypothetical protein
MGSYHVRPESPKILNRAAEGAKVLRSKTCGRLYLEDTRLERLAQGLEDMALELGQLIQEEEAVVHQGHFPRQEQLTAADQVHSGDGVVRGPERARDDEGGAPTRQAGGARDAGGLPCVRQAHRRQEGGEATSLPPGDPNMSR